MSSHQADNLDASIRPEKIKNAVIIGAGISGIVSGVHLIRAGINVTVLERVDNFGGAWSYSPELDRDSPFPSIRPPSPDWSDLEKACVEGRSLERWYLSSPLPVQYMPVWKVGIAPP